MEFHEAVRARAMVRSFSTEAVPAAVVEWLLDAALRAPTAGNTRGTAWVLLVGDGETRRYWQSTTTAAWREQSRRWGGLSSAPVVALSYASPAIYVDRYGNPDKVRSGLGPAGPHGGGEEAWPVPYWYGDAAFGVMTLLLGAVAEGLGACFLGNFRGEDRLAAELEVPTGWRFFGAVVLGYASGVDHPSPSLGRVSPPRASRLHRGRWSST